MEHRERHGFNVSDQARNSFMLKGGFAEKGYDWWWHSFTARNEKTGEEKPFFIEFFTVNPALGQDEPVFGQLKENKESGVRPSYLMVKVGCWGEDARQLHRFFGWNQVNINNEIQLHISADNCFCSETRTLGKVEVSEEDALAHPEWMCQAGKMVWDLNIEKKVAFNVGYGAGWPSRELEAFEMFWHVEGMKTEYSGTILWNDEKYIVEKENSYGYADKNWGSDFTSPWIWLASSHLKSKLTGQWLENTCFDIGGGSPKVGPKRFEGIILGGFYYEGEPYEFNFSKFWTLTKNDIKCKETKDKLIWKITQETPIAKLEIEASCLKKDMLLINYEAPDGSKRHNKLWNGGNGVAEVKLYQKVLKTKNPGSNRKPKFEWELIDHMEAYNMGCEYGEFDKEENK